MMNLILGISLYPVILILSLVYYKTGKNNSKTVFGVHLTEVQKKDHRFALAAKRYKSESLFIFIVLALIPVAFFFTRHVSIQFTLWMLWFIAALIAMVIPYVHANKAMMSIKTDGKTSPPADTQNPTSTSTLQYIETNIVRTVKLSDFLPQMIISVLAPIALFLLGKVFYRDANSAAVLEVYLWSSLSFALITFVFFWVAKLMDRTRALVISSDSSINAGYNRSRKYIWKKSGSMKPGSMQSQPFSLSLPV